MDPLFGSIWGLACAMSSWSDSEDDKPAKGKINPKYLCAVCSSSNLQCWKCERISLKQEIISLKSELSKYNQDKLESLILTSKYKQLMTKVNLGEFHQSDNNNTFEYKSRLSLSHFLTITFDPVKFGFQPNEYERKNYILSRLCRLVKDELIKEVYGSFERHKNGIIHAHCIIIAQQEDKKEIKQYLHDQFTDNPYNRIVIDMGPAKYPQAMDYINKESDHYFHIRPWPLKFKEATLEDYQRLQKQLHNPNKPSDFDYGIV